MDEEERKMERMKEGEKGSSREPLRLASEENWRDAENAVFCKILRLKDECEQRKVKPFLFSRNDAGHSTLNVFPRILRYQDTTQKIRRCLLFFWNRGYRRWAVSVLVGTDVGNRRVSLSRHITIAIFTTGTHQCE